MEQQGLDLIDIIHKGAIATYPLILLSIVMIRHLPVFASTDGDGVEKDTAPNRP